MGSRNAKGRMIYWKISYSKQLSRCSVFAKLLFTWMIPNSDDLGRLEGEPEILKGMIFPYDEKISVKNIKDALSELAREELLVWYQVDGNRYIQFPNFAIYQKLRADRNYNSDYPSPPEFIGNCGDKLGDCMTCQDMSCQVGQNLREGKVSEEKRREGKDGKIPYTEIQETFNRICVSFAKVKQLSEGRKDKLKTRWPEFKTLETFEAVCEQMEISSFLKGNNNRKWKATFDWIIDNSNNWVKTLEGQYADKSNNNSPDPPKQVIR